jgi:Uma2 family endonuclease
MAQRMTVAEYLALPEEKPYLEYVCGEVTPKVAPSFEHSVLALELGGYLRDCCREHGGVAGVEPRVRFLDEPRGRVHVLDLGYWAPGRPIGDHRAMSPPTLAIEIRSPDQSLNEQRCATMRRFGVPGTWLVDPEAHTIETAEDETERVFGPGDTLTSAFLPGLAIDIDALFSGLDQFSDA